MADKELVMELERDILWLEQGCATENEICEHIKQAIKTIIKHKEKENSWNTGTPTEDGFYLCKVHYGDIPDDMRILEWVSDMGCFCLPESKIRGYHFYVGDEGVEVVYEWQRLAMRFHKEHGGWLEP